MLELPPRVPVNIKRRSVSAVRTFPKGCGPRKVEARPNPPPTPPPVESEAKPKKLDADGASEASSSGKCQAEEPLGAPEVTEGLAEDGAKEGSAEADAANAVNVNGHVENLDNIRAENCSKAELGETLAENGVNLGADTVKEEPSSLEKCVNGDLEEEKVPMSILKRFPGLKRRKVSAIRKFPAGCGRVPSMVCKAAGSGTKPAASSESKTVGDMKKAVAEDEVRQNWDAAKCSDIGESYVKTEVEVRKEDASLIGGTTQEADHKDVYETPKVETAVEEVRRNESEQMKVKVKEYSSGSTTKASELKSSKEEKRLGKQKLVMEGSDSASSAEMSEDEVSKYELKRVGEYAQESSSNFQVKSPLRSSSSESLVGGHSVKKMLVESTDEKLDVRDAKKIKKKVRVEEWQERALAVVKPEDKAGGKLLAEQAEKGSIRIYENCKNLKRGLPEEEEEDENMEDYMDKLIVQSLMAAKKCPWRKGRKSGAATACDATPKSKSKKAKKLLGSCSKPTPRGASSSLNKNRSDMNDEEEASLADGGNEMALTLYDGPSEWCINLPPSVPPGPAQNEEAGSRRMVKMVLRLFNGIFRKLVQEEEKRSNVRQEGNYAEGRQEGNYEEGRQEGSYKGSKKKNRPDLEAARVLKPRWVNHSPMIGHVPGVEVGDEFHYRVELAIVGLHRPYQAGIDFTNKGGTHLATSIVASGGYPDDINNSDVLIYSGSGGGNTPGDKQAGDQKLERGNLALKNSIDFHSPVRVIYGCKELIKDSRDAKPKQLSTFTYDGLYMVEKYWQEQGNKGFNVFKFQLRRIPGQPEIAQKEIKKTKKSKVREGICVKDISDGRESKPISAVNTVDSERPLPFKYITRVMYPSWYVMKPPRGCDCIDGCSDSEKCACAMKNGGEIPFNFNGAIVQAKPLVYECGPSCKCPPSCHNRVSQHGIQLPLEIFKTKTRGWGVRSLHSIPSGTFVCEYVGEMLQEEEAEKRTNDEYLFDIGHNYDDQTLWEGLPGYIPAVGTDSELKDVGFTIDAAEYGNVGRFINHCCSPNLYAQNLLYDHDDKRVPHVMFFAADNIPPLQELTYHYNYSLDHVRDSAGNIKKKECYCGSPECTGRLY